MHASSEQLLARRDGEPLDATVVAHIEACAECRDAQARMETTRRALRELPELTPPPELWNHVADRVAANNQRPRRILAAAAVIAATLVIALIALDGPGPVPQAPEKAVVVPEDSPASRNAVTLLADRSRLMERQLRQLRQNSPAVVRVGHQIGRARVESRLRALDYGISRVSVANADPSVRRDYWNERVRLLDSMLEMERAELINRDLAAYRVVPVGQRQ